MHKTNIVRFKIIIGSIHNFYSSDFEPENISDQDLLWCIFGRKWKSGKTCLRRKPTDRGQHASGIVIRDVVFVGNHDVTVSSVGEGVSVGFVQVTGASGVSGGVVGEVGHVGRVGHARLPAALQS